MNRSQDRSPTALQNGISKMLRYLLFSFTLLIAGCSQSGQPPSVPSQQILRANISTEPPSLDPTQANDTTSSVVLKMLFEGLTRIDAEGVPQLALAESVEISEDQKTYRFTLREAYWTSGRKILAHDFAYAWRMSLSPAYPSPGSYLLYIIKNAQQAKEGMLPVNSVGIHAVSDAILEVELESPAPYFLELCATHYYYPINYVESKANPDWARDSTADYTSNGPFRLISWKHSNEIRLEKNPFYWDRDNVQLEQIHLSMIDDPSTELHLFEEGALDWAGSPLSVGLPSDSIPALKDSGAFHNAPIAATYFYQLNTQIPPLNNKKIRLALSYALDRASIVHHLTQSGEIPALGMVPTVISYRDEGYFQDHQASLAKELFLEGLVEEGLSLEELPELRLSYNSNESHHRIAQVIQQQWNEVLGLQTHLESAEWKVYLDQLARQDFHIARLSWIAAFQDPINFLEIFKYKEAGLHNTSWENALYIQLLEQAEESTSMEERKQLLIEAETLLMEEMPVAPLFFLTATYLKNPQLKGVVLSNIGSLDFKWAYFVP